MYTLVEHLLATKSGNLALKIDLEARSGMKIRFGADYTLCGVVLSTKSLACLALSQQLGIADSIVVATRKHALFL
jgi:hypothetical protein